MRYVIKDNINLKYLGLFRSILDLLYFAINCLQPIKKKKFVYNLFSFIFIFIFYILNVYYLSLLIGTNRFLKKKKKKGTNRTLITSMNKNGEEEENRLHKNCDKKIRRR